MSDLCTVLDLPMHNLPPVWTDLERNLPDPAAFALQTHKPVRLCKRDPRQFRFNDVKCDNMESRHVHCPACTTACDLRGNGLLD